MNQIISWIKEHKIISIMLGFILLFAIIAIIYAITNSSNQQDKLDDNNALVQVQDTSNDPTRPSFESEEIALLGFDDLYSTHSNSWFSGISAIVRLYARTEDLSIQTINLVKDSYKNPSSRETSLPETMTITLNNRRNTFELEISGTYGGMLYTLKQDGKTVFERVVSTTNRYVVNETEIPEWLNSGPNILFTIVDGFVPEILGGLPEIKVGDKIRAYYACIEPNQTSYDNCYVYKYDFYY